MTIKIFVSSVGKTAALTGRYLSEVSQDFPFDHAFLFTSEEYLWRIQQVYACDYVSVLPIKNPYNGQGGYTESVSALFYAIKNISRGEIPCEVILNSSGGCEKMSLILRDLADVLVMYGFSVTSIWGSYSPDRGVLHTVKPSAREIFAQIREDAGEYFA